MWVTKTLLLTAPTPAPTLSNFSNLVWLKHLVKPLAWTSKAPPTRCSTYVAELQGEALSGLQLRRAKVQLSGGAAVAQLDLRGRQLLLRLVHGGRQGEVEGTAGVCRLAQVDGALARHILKART